MAINQDKQAAEYRNLAETARKVAAQLSLQDERLEVLKAAEQWEAQAAEDERRRPVTNASAARLP